MIVPMARIQVAVRWEDQDALLRVLARLGAVHMVPVDVAAAVPSETIAAEQGRVGRALQILGHHRPAGRPPALEPARAVQLAASIQRRLERRRARLARLRRRLERLAFWGDVTREQLDDLERAGTPVRVFSVPAARLDEVQGELVQPLGPTVGGRVLVAVVGDPARLRVPPDTQVVPRPARDPAALRAEVRSLQRDGRRDERRLARLAHLVPELEALRASVDEAAQWSVARHSALEAEGLLAFQGWVPTDEAPRLAAELERAGLAAALQWTLPQAGETPPTLIRYPRWARPIRGLFDLLGTVPGYNELDVSGFFMIALPLFAGIIIGDAGYGLIFLLLPLLFRRRLLDILGDNRLVLLLSFGAAALVWGAVTGVWLGVTPEELVATGGPAAGLGEWLYRLQWIRGSEEQMRATMIKICFVIGSVHLIAAHLRRFAALAPAQEALAEIGWCLVLAAMVGLIWILFFGEDEALPALLRPAVVAGLIAGLTLVIGFMAPHANPLKRLGLGIAGSLLPLINAFGDTLSYIRLMAVGLATHYIAAAFNTLSFSLAGAATWFAGAPVLAFGHLLNLALVLLAIFAHGVRLNMLEFSSNAGVQWSGYPYRPFVHPHTKET
jgi:V/A-type H+/Na+-transporting ATPase subunit I